MKNLLKRGLPLFYFFTLAFFTGCLCGCRGGAKSGPPKEAVPLDGDDEDNQEPVGELAVENGQHDVQKPNQVSNYVPINQGAGKEKGELQQRYEQAKKELHKMEVSQHEQDGYEEKRKAYREQRKLLYKIYEIIKEDVNSKYENMKMRKEKSVEYEKLKQDCSALQDRLEEKMNQINDLVKTLKKHDKENARRALKIEHNVKPLEEDLKSMKQNLENLEQELHKLEQKLEELDKGWKQKLANLEQCWVEELANLEEDLKKEEKKLEKYLYWL